MPENSEVIVLSENEKVENMNQTSFLWRGSYEHDRALVFRRTYEIAHKAFATPLENCRYRVNEREFTDLSFTECNYTVLPGGECIVMSTCNHSLPNASEAFMAAQGPPLQASFIVAAAPALP